jgi:hypothetical protein
MPSAASNFQLGQDNAEQWRNYQAQFEGNPGGNGQAWGGPDAYGMLGMRSGAEFQPGTEAEMYARLAQLRKFDPNASIMQQSRTSGGEGGGTEQKYYTMNFDDSKLPHSDVNPNQAVQAGTYGENLQNNDNVVYDPHYGAQTSRQNLKNEHSWLDYSPALVAGFAFGAPMLAGAMSGGALGAGAGAAAEGLGTNLVGPGLEAGETGAFDVAGSYGSGIPGSLGAGQGAAESSLYGADALANPAQALNSGSSWMDKIPDILRNMPTSKPKIPGQAQGTSGQAEDDSPLPRRSVANALRNQGYQGYRGYGT